MFVIVQHSTFHAFMGEVQPTVAAIPPPTKNIHLQQLIQDEKKENKVLEFTLK